jgi:hypothetical protein
MMLGAGAAEHQFLNKLGMKHNGRDFYIIYILIYFFGQNASFKFLLKTK